jgi:hypothetical protein
MVPAPRGQQAQPPQPAAGTPPAGGSIRCGRDHAGLGGILDETARRLSHEELAVAEQLASEGHHVRSLAPRPGRGRTPDLLVCAALVEVKSWLSREARGGIAPGAQSVVNKLIQAEGQAATVVLNGRGSGLSSSAAEAGIRFYEGLRHRAHIATVRVLGDGFDLEWARQPSIRRDRAAAPARRFGPEPGLDR